MTTQALKQKIADDVQTLKRLDIDIIDAKTYYFGNLKGFAVMFGGFFFLQLLACIPPYILGLWKHAFDEPHHDAVVFKMFAGSFFATLFMMLFFYSKIKHYVIFNEQIRSRLKTGNYFIKKIHQAVVLMYAIYTGLVFLFMLLAGPDSTFFVDIAAFIFTVIGLIILIDMEVTRIGSNVLFKAVSDYFAKDKQKIVN